MISGTDRWEALYFVVVGLVLAAGTSAIIHAALAKSRRGRESGCGRCGYLVKGLTDFICSECGCDVREVGIELGGSANSAFLVAMISGLAVAGGVIVVGGWLAL